VQKRLSRGLPTYIAFFDYSKCFDSICREVLWFKLAKMGISEKVLNILMHLYKSACFSIRVEGGISEPVQSRTGVQQGSQLSPTLFLYVINDLADRMRKVERSYPPTFGDYEIPMLLYADEACLISNSPSGLQMLIDEMSACREWGLPYQQS